MKKLYKPLLITLLTFAVVHVAFLRVEPRTHIGYQLWKRGVGPKMKSYTKLFLKDRLDHDSWKGKPVADLQKRFPELNDGKTFPADSYRGKSRDVQAKHFGIQTYWFDNSANGFGWCVRVKNGVIERLVLVKG